jgi:triacylglycerol lipase
MLASLLRRLIFIQAAVGAILGFMLHRLAGTTPWSSLVGALLMPLFASFLVCLVSGLRSKAKGEPIGHWLRSVWGEFRATVLIFLLRQPWTVETPYALPATGGTPQIPVVLVHGYLCNHRVWDSVAKGLRAQGTPCWR